LIALTIVQLIAVAMAGLALLVGVWMMVIARRPWRRGDEKAPAPRVRLLGLSYILVFGSAMVQVVLQPRGEPALALGALMVMGGVIVIAVVALEGRAKRRADPSATVLDRLDRIRTRTRTG